MVSAHLVRAAQAGDREAFGELVRRFEKSLFAAALRRVRNHAEAQDLVQEVFVMAFRKIGQLRQPEAFGGWLRTILRRLAINRAQRRLDRTLTEGQALDALCLDASTPVQAALDHEAQQTLRDGLARLSDMDRQTLEAFYLRGQSILEMSAQFDSPVGTIKRRLHVARKRLAEELESLATA
ncbi:MAG: sigma-70 family RNA polymerase sigma factor [Pirellulales bacterium]|nr:sigma-70 family RNA polymerase sigma factor [Pirellulales bacterium]